mmetsp:Transcript_6434/g.19003  ORF Transcript_6434/g.19003 Transcript_6434/m.19003 type:complete len:488 (+) Transcript_6434:199-1662(+)|eukprot:CAMPEP_0119558558 /NCGR_PEP_ID=MMETSP1352-20130426/10859_1 /TAXON_ID=265584 /ORGANISM="Stauroneis constricta, Strain CCMP1120" /LENGTH=487 /DNA_ID=CAMNT_0007605947 /DNA_START=202 /DNA_END=1665 /DNA_ORIENTATION=+
MLPRSSSAMLVVGVLAVQGVSLASAFVQHATTAPNSPAFIVPGLARKMSPSGPSRRLGTAVQSSIGDDDLPPRNDDGDDDELDNFLAPKEESEDLIKAREYMSDESLPLSYTEDDDGDDDEEEGDDDDEDLPLNGKSGSSANGSANGSSAMVYGGNGAASNNAASKSALFGQNEIPSDVLAKNPYMQVVSKLTPSEMISRFTATSHPRVQEAVRTTILGLIGNLPKMAFDTTTITTGQRLASLMFQLQMTGYMFKNAEYRLSLSQSLGMSPSDYKSQSSEFLLSGGTSDSDDGDDDDADNDEDPLLSGKIRGKLKVRYGKRKDADNEDDDDSDSDSDDPSSNGVEMEVDAAAYMSELRAEVSRLKEELTTTQKDKEDALRKDLLLYIRTLPKKELQSLTNTMSQDVLVSMKGLVQVVLQGIGDGKLGPDTVTEQSGEAMAQLCMWQLVLGYNLRELEVREQMKKSLSAIGAGNSDGGVDINEPGTLE